MPDRTLSVSEKTARYKAAYEQREVNLLLVYERCMKTLELQLSTIEGQLTDGMAYKDGVLNKDLLKFSCDISKSIKELTKLHIQVQQLEARNFKSYNLEQKKEFTINYILALPPGHRQDVLNTLSELLLFKYERKLPVGGQAKDFIHPLDRKKL